MERKKNKIIKILRLIILVCGTLYFMKSGLDILFREKEVLVPEEVVISSEESSMEEVVIPKLEILDEDSNSRIIAVMINNHKSARPQSGLRDAFLNYEIVVEAGITRIMSLYKDKDTSRIGSVRSARHYFLDYALENDAIYVHIGQSPKAGTDITTLGVNTINGLKSYSLYWRDKTLNVSSEHTAFTSMERIKKLIKSKGYRETSDKKLLFNYNTLGVDLTKQNNVITASKVYIEYSSYTNTSYEYDEVNKIYVRSMNGVIQKDYVTKEEITAKNIITYQVKNKALDSSGRQELENIGSGNGYYITEGYAVPITWEKESRSSQTIYKYKNGDEIEINDGITWIQIQPVGKKITIE